MKVWMSRIAVGFSILVIVGGLGLFLNRSYFIRGFVEGMYVQKVSIFEHFPLSAGDVVMLGDSITEGGLWNEIFPQQPIKNRGIGGDTTTGVLARLEPLISSHPAAIFLKIGTNDLTHGPDRSVSYRQYREIVDRIQKVSPNTNIYLQSLLPRAANMRNDVEAFNREIETIANEKNIVFINLYPAFLAEDGSIIDDITGDELHLNGEGYRIWQQQLQPHMDVYAQ